MVCVVICFGCYLVCKKHYGFMASYSLDHYFNKHFQRIVEKLRENVISSQNVKGTKTTKINSILPFHVTIICNTRISHYTLLHFML